MSSLARVGPPLPKQRGSFPQQPVRTLVGWNAFLSGLTVDLDLEDGCIDAEHGDADYSVEGLLGKGAFGRVYSMQIDEEDASLPPKFTLKLIRADKAMSEFQGLRLLSRGLQTIVPGVMLSPKSEQELRDMWARQEAKGANEADEYAVVAMPEMDETLSQLCRRMVLEPEEAAGIACVVAQTAKMLWEGEVMLNDIKSDNIMFKHPAPGQPLFPRLVDYGCFIDKTSGCAYSCTFPPPEAVHFYEPEDGTSERVPCSESSVVWQIGVLMLYMLNGSAIRSLAFDRLRLISLRYKREDTKRNHVYSEAHAVADRVLRSCSDERFSAAVTYALRRERTLDGLIKHLLAYPDNEHSLAFSNDAL